MTWHWSKWRKGSYWILMVDWDYSDGRHQPGSVMSGKCWRCGATMGIALPVDLFTGPLLMGAFDNHHSRCKQSLTGARWDLIITLRYRRSDLERTHARKPPPRFKARAEVLLPDLTQIHAWETDGGP